LASICFPSLLFPHEKSRGESGIVGASVVVVLDESLLAAND
jgi:hypothetical protein